MNKYLLFVLTIMMVCVGFFAVAEEAEPTKYTSGDYEYVLLEDGTIEIIKYSSLAKASSVDIPSEIDGYVVSSIGNRAFSTNFVKSVSIPDCVMRMGDNPFSSCTKLNSIYVSPENLYFAVIDDVLFYKPEKKLICFPSGIVQESYEIPLGIKIIGGAAFSWNDCLTSISIPDGVTRIEEGAFQICYELTEVNIPESVVYIGDYSFSSCELLTAVSIPEGVTKIGDKAFYACPKLTVTVERDSYAANWCKENDVKYIYPDSLDWLNK